MDPAFTHNADLYVCKPVTVTNGIPVFSKTDAYVENYEKISRDHVSQISESQENPFMEEELWVSLEASTRAYIQKHVRQGSRILDVGVGLGRLLEPLVEYERYGVDISLDYLAIAKRRGIEVAMAKIEELPYKAGYFDAIVVCDVLEHVFDLNHCSEKILSCLRPGGVLIVRVPFKEDLDVYLREDLPYEFIHLRNFDEASLRLHFQKIFGLHFLEASPTTPYLQGTPRLKLRLLPEATRSKLAQMAANRPEFFPVISAMQVSEESFQAWIYDLKDNSKALYNDISGDLILGIDMNAAFLKPYGESESRRALRAGSVEASQRRSEASDQDAVNLQTAFLSLSHDVVDLRTTLLSLSHDFMEARSVAQTDTLRFAQLLENHVTSVGQQIASVNQSLGALYEPFHKKAARALRRIFKL